MEGNSEEAYLLLLLSDTNLPTGSFVASSGLESYIAHGFLSPTVNTDSQTPFIQEDAAPLPPRLTSATISFMRDSVHAYANSARPFVGAVHRALDQRATPYDSVPFSEEDALKEILQLDSLYESTTLNHVARRASKAQGIALLSLYTKGFSQPEWVPKSATSESSARTNRFDALVERLKTLVRRGSTPGHLPICWAVLAASLGLSRERSEFLHIFLFARTLLSASVRLNTIGPYAAQQLLLHVIKPMVEAVMEATNDLNLRLNKPDVTLIQEGPGEDSWEMDPDAVGPANTWPLGEILASRHDLQHSRIFNS